MTTKRVPGGAERQALFDELSAVFARCGAEAAAIASDRAGALAQVPEAQQLIVKHDAVVVEAQRKTDRAEQNAERVRSAAVQAADAAFFERAQAADAKRQVAGIDLDGERSVALQDARELFENTIRAIHSAIAGLPAVADAEKRARDERDKAIRQAEHQFRDAIEQADDERRDALDSALSQQIAAHAAADNAASDAVASARAAFEDARDTADRLLDAGLAAIPAARSIVDDAQRRLDTLRARCRAQQAAIEARLRGDA